METKKMIEIKKTGITDLDTDAIVNAANSGLHEGSGVCGAIFAAAGREDMTGACRKIGGCRTGGAVITPGFALKADYVIHAVGPIYSSSADQKQLADELYSCYRESLELARKNGCHSIGFPLISTGVFGYPKDSAWETAISSCMDWLGENPDYPMEVVFAVLDDETMRLGQRTLESKGA